jgi:Tol biopolymer transport system component
MGKTSMALAGIVILGAAILGAWSPPQAEDPAVLLRAAIEKEEVDGNLDAAIEQYRHIIKIAGANRSVAAQALLRLGGCYERRGPEEARHTYQQLIHDYAEQAKEVAAARQRLAALTGGAPAPGRESRLTIRRVPDLDMYAKPSPDGKYLAFLEWKAGNLAVLDAATGATRMLTKEGSYGEPVQMAQFSAWSRDSSRIAYQWDFMVPKDAREELRIASVKGDTPPVAIALPAPTTLIPRDWSPDGSRILAYGAAGRERTVALVDVAGRRFDKLDLPPSRWLEYRFTEDGNAILHSAPADGKAGRNDIFLHDLKTGVSTPVVQHPAEDLLVGMLPGTEWLFFASDRRGGLDLWAVPFRRGKADGQPVLVRQGLGRFFPLGFTNDGRYYYATLSATDDVYLADFDRDTGKITGEARKLTSRWDGVSADPSFSPDGGTLAYVVKRSPVPIPTGTFDSLVLQSLKDPKADPVVVGFDDVGLTRVGYPCWSADGKTIVVYGSRIEGQDSALYRVELPTLRKTEIKATGEGRLNLRDHDCAAGGPFVYLTAQGPGQTTGQAGQIVRIDMAGGPARPVFQAPQGQDIGGFALSPNGSSLSVVTGLDRNRRALLVMPSEGGTPRQVLEFRQPTGGGVAVAWAPDGRSILYVVRSEQRTGSLSFELYSVRVDEAAAPPELIYKWAGQFFGLRFHPNGRQLAFTGRATYSVSSEVWVIENLREELKLLASSAARRTP